MAVGVEYIVEHACLALQYAGQGEWRRNGSSKCREDSEYKHVIQSYSCIGHPVILHTFQAEAEATDTRLPLSRSLQSGTRVADAITFYSIDKSSNR